MRSRAPEHHCNVKNKTIAMKNMRLFSLRLVHDTTLNGDGVLWHCVTVIVHVPPATACLRK